MHSISVIDYDRPLERGVWLQPYRSRRGRPVLVSVNHLGCWTNERIVREGADPWVVAAEMRRELDDRDPLPNLHLVRDDVPAASARRLSPGAFCRMIGAELPSPPTSLRR